VFIVFSFQMNLRGPPNQPLGQQMSANCQRGPVSMDKAQNFVVGDHTFLRLAVGGWWIPSLVHHDLFLLS